MATRTYSNPVILGELSGSVFNELVEGGDLGTATLTTPSDTMTVNETVDLQVNGQDYSTATYIGYTLAGDGSEAPVLQVGSSYYALTSNGIDGVPDTLTAADFALCYARGTRIATPAGERRVEALAIGDLVLTVVGETLVPQPIKWIGRRRIDLRAHPRPHNVAPVRIQRNAIGDAAPHTDLLLSPDHAVFFDDKLVAARQLVNGTTIRQETSRPAVEYFHIQLDAHAILLAQGLPAESYLDTGNAGFFENAGAPSFCIRI